MREKAQINPKFLDKDGNLLPELKKFNWGAFFWTWIWGLENKSYITLIDLLSFIPIFAPIHIVIAIWAGMEGNEWALTNKKWKSIAHFQNIQKRWAICGSIIPFILIATIVALLIPSFATSLEQEYRINHKRAITSLNQFATLNHALNSKKIYSLSSKEITDYFFEGSSLLSPEKNFFDGSSLPPAKRINDTKFADNKGTTYTFQCKNQQCTVMIDVNGDEEPNKVSTKEKLQDRLIHKIEISDVGVPSLTIPDFLYKN